MGNFREKLHRKLEDGARYEQSLDPYIESVSRRLWPWQEKKLLFLVLVLLILDFCSTYAFLELSGNPDLYECNPVARWALENGGFFRLFLYDLAAACILILIAFGARHIYRRKGFKGYGRLSFILVLVPYIVITMAAIFNNVALTFVR